MTSDMVAPLRAAAKTTRARSFWAAAYQKSESWKPPRSPVTRWSFPTFGLVLQATGGCGSTR